VKHLTRWHVAIALIYLGALVIGARAWDVVARLNLFGAAMGLVIGLNLLWAIPALTGALVFGELM
jgi:hypothetical protein